MANSSMEIRALLVGATGLVGGHCLGELLYDNDFSTVTVLTRRPLDWVPPKLTVHVVDFDHLRDHAEAFNAVAALTSVMLPEEGTFGYYALALTEGTLYVRPHGLRIVWNRDRPSDRAAASWLGWIESIPER